MPDSFGGVPFGPLDLFNDAEARDVLGSFMDPFRVKLALSRVLPQTSQAPSRVRGAGEFGWRTGAWDVIPFQFAGDEEFTGHPHLGAWLTHNEVGIQVVVPNGARDCWKRLSSLDEHAFADALSEVMRRIRHLRHPVPASVWEPRVVIDIVQRHFHPRRRDFDDARLTFDLDVLFEAGNPRARNVPAWLSALLLVLAEHKHANMQLELMACYPLSEGSVSRGPGFVDAAVRAAEALQPFLELLMREETH